MDILSLSVRLMWHKCYNHHNQSSLGCCKVVYWTISFKHGKSLMKNYWPVAHHQSDNFAFNIFWYVIFCVKTLLYPTKPLLAFIYYYMRRKYFCAFNFCILWQAQNFATTKISQFMVHAFTSIYAHYSVCLINRD